MYSDLSSVYFSRNKCLQAFSRLFPFINYYFLLYYYLNINSSVIMKLLLSFLLLILRTCSVLNIDAVPLSYTINDKTTYTWTIQFQNSATRENLTLNFPNAVTFSNNTEVFDTTSTKTQLTIVSAIDNSITFTLQAGSQTDLSFEFQVTNVVNPPYSYEGELSYQSNIETSDVKQNPPTTITYTTGVISDCSIRFDGETSDENSTAFIEFTAANSINEGSPTTLQFRIQYDIYTSSTLKITSNGNVNCSFSTDGGSTYSSPVTAQQDTSIPDFTCTFSSTSISASQPIILKLENVQNPFTSTGYSVFKLTTADATYDYDEAPSCSNMEVDLRTYTGQFSESLKVNSEYSSVSVVSDLFVPFTVRTNDQLLMEYTQTEATAITFSSCSTVIRLQRQSDSSVNFTKQSDSSYVAGDENRGTQQLYLYLIDCIVTMPPSESPLLFTFTFLRDSLSFMEITASLTATFAIIDASSVSLQIAETDIAGQYPYIFTIVTSEPLGTNPRLLLEIPIQIGTQGYNGNCEVKVNNAGLGNATCTLIDSVNNIFEVVILDNADIAANSSIEITLTSLTNPTIPDTYTAFDIQIYYDNSDQNSLTEKGTSLLSQTYGSRVITPTLESNQYTVYEESTVVILYENGVDLPINSKIIITFSLNLTELSYSFFEVNGVNQTLIPQNSGQTFTIVYNQVITSSSSIRIGFDCRVPSQTGTFEVVDMLVTDSSGTQYEATAESLLMSVNTAAEESFDVTPQTLVTGALTSYTIYFYSNIEHNLPFYLDVQFPGDVDFQYNRNGVLAECSGDCDTAILDESSGGTTKIRVTISASQNGNSYTVSISNVANPTVVGTTGIFTFKTLTTAEAQIIWGQSTALIQLPNDITASLATSQNYYRSNTGPVKLELTVTNSLSFNDYFRIIFQHQTYSLNPNSSDVQCVEGSCSIHNSSTSSVTVVQIIPNLEQTATTNMTFIIQNLISSQTTNYQQSFDIQIKSYSAIGLLKDKGYFTYSIDCGSSSDIRSKNCKTCNELETQCFSCYEEDAYYLYGTQCTNNCGDASQYETFANSGFCVNCVSPCDECYSASQCKTCIPGYYLYENQTCLSTCSSSEGLYSTTVDSQNYCYACWDSDCIYCQTGASDACQECNTSLLIDGKCEDNCGLSNTYTVDGVCYNCDTSCDECNNGNSNTDCVQCASGYYNVSGACVDECPTGTVVIGSLCGCDSSCKTCSGLDTNCTSCSNSSHLLYNGQCISECPASTYNFSNECLDCTTGCLTCVNSGCQQCLSGYNIYNGECYSECNTLGDRFAPVNGFCVKCAEGCDVCDESSACVLCLPNYNLTNGVCQYDCEQDNSCTTTTENVLPLPGLLSVVLWFVLLLLLKFLVVNQLYIPYAFLFFSSVIQLVLVFLLLSLTDEKITSVTTRLLQTTQTYLNVVFGLLITVLVINYLTNILYFVVFCKYIKKLIEDRQVDYISNYVVVGVGVLANFRFCLISFSRMFPKPTINANNSSQLTPVHYVCGISILNTVLIAGVVGTLIYNEEALTDIFMLSIDLLIIIILNVIFSIWMMTKSKPDEYFETKKKYQLEENYKAEENNKTQEQFQPVNERDISKTKLVENDQRNSTVLVIENFDESEIYQKQQAKSDFQNKPLPIIPIRASKMNFDKMVPKGREKSQSEEESKRDMSMDEPIRFTEVKKEKGEEEQTGLKRKKQKTQNFSKNNQEDKKQQKHQKPKQQIESFQEDYRDQPIEEMNSAVFEKKLMKPMKLTSQRSTMLKNMKKKQGVGFFESEGAESNLDEVDFQAIIQSKMIDKTMVPRKQKAKSEMEDDEAHEEISPSWFNIQNQRFDASQSDDL